MFGTRYLFLHDTINTVFSYINTFLLFIQGQLSNYHYSKSFHNKFRVCFKYYRHHPFRSILQDRVSGVFLTNIKRSEGLICEHKKIIFIWNACNWNVYIFMFERNPYSWMMMLANSEFVCVEVLRPSQPNGVMSSAVSLPSHTFTGQA